MVSKMMKPCQNFIEKKHPRKGEKRKQGARIQVWASKQSNKGRPEGGKGTTKKRTFHQLHEANRLKKVKVNLI
jgi:hypothetical protein